MSLPIAQLGQPVLRRVADAVSLDQLAEPDFHRFVEAMRQTLDASGGVGLAAPQVFVSRRVFLARIAPGSDDAPPPPAEVFVNPRIVAVSQDAVTEWEGCLSFPELLVLVPRPSLARIEYLTPNGEQRTLDLAGFAARVVQHEYDHLNGVLTIDRAVSTQDIVKASEIQAVLDEREPR